MASEIPDAARDSYKKAKGYPLSPKFVLSDSDERAIAAVFAAGEAAARDAVPPDVVKLLYDVWDTMWNKVGFYEPGHKLVSDGVELKGIVSLIDFEDAEAIDAACCAVEPHATMITERLGIAHGSAVPQEGAQE